MKHFPLKVRLRDGRMATLTGLVTLGADNDQRLLEGKHHQCNAELWFTNGRWSEHGTDHPLDIVVLFKAGGQPVLFNQEAVA